jgi:hypothetical protein
MIISKIIKYLKNWYRKYRDNIEKEKILERDGCVLFCHGCKTPLNGTGNYLSNGWYKSTCQCGLISVFDLDYPVPVRINQ